MTSLHSNVRGGRFNQFCNLKDFDAVQKLDVSVMSQLWSNRISLRRDTIRHKCGFEVGEIIEACAVQQRKALKRIKRQAPKIALSGDLAYYA